MRIRYLLGAVSVLGNILSTRQDELQVVFIFFA